jgi:hypothetical protein
MLAHPRSTEYLPMRQTLIPALKTRLRLPRAGLVTR